MYKAKLPDTKCVGGGERRVEQGGGKRRVYALQCFCFGVVVPALGSARLKRTSVYALSNPEERVKSCTHVCEPFRRETHD